MEFTRPIRRDMLRHNQLESISYIFQLENQETKMKLPTFTLLPALGLLMNAPLPAHANVRENGGNCEGVKSCRPRCISVRVERDVLSCGTSEGIFTVNEDINPWDIKRFQTTNCKTTDTCVNDLCGLELDGDLTVRIGEEGHSGSSYFYSAFELAESGDDRFTFCSIYPCTKEECSLPEQMVRRWNNFLYLALPKWELTHFSFTGF